MAKSTKKRNALGRGLGALLDDTSSSVESQLPSDTIKSQSSSEGIGEVPIEQIEVNPFQPRTDFDEEALNELADSIRVHGIIQPITLRQLSDNSYQLISGERRFQASKRAGLEKIPAYIRKADDQQMLEMALIENIQRENLNAIEIALSYQRLLDECNLKHEELGDRVGKKRSTVNNYLRLLKLPPDVQIALRDGRLSMGHARAIINIENVEQQLNIFHQILTQGLSVRAVEELVRGLTKKSPSSVEKPASGLNVEMKKVQNNLSNHFGTRIKIQSTDNEKGEIKIPFVSVEDFNRILEILQS